MTLANRYDYKDTAQLSLSLRATESTSLSLVLEQQARTLRGVSAMIATSSQSKADVGGYGLLDFRDLVIEQNAWLNFLLNRGVSKGEAVVVCLPYSPGLIAICYALFKIGAHVVLVESGFNWKVGAPELRRHDPKHLVGTGDVLSYSKWISQNSGEVSRIEILDPHRPVGSAIRAFQARHIDWGKECAALTIVDVSGVRCVSASFEQKQLCLLATYFKDWFDLGEGDRGVPGNLLEALIFPAAGLTSVIAGEYLSDQSLFSVEHVMEAVERFDVSIVSGNEGFWRSALQLVELGKCSIGKAFHGIVRTAETCNRDLNTISKILPNITFHEVFGTACNPFVSKSDKSIASRGGTSFRGVYVGKPLPGIQVSLLCCEDMRWVDEPGAATPVGEIATAKRDYAPLDDPESWERTGELGFFDYDGGLWYCGGKSDLIGTTFGGFCPVRCETVFNRHPKVERCALIALRKNGKTRPGLVVETKLGDLPKRGVEESKFKAELLQLAMDIEETSIIVDIFFSDRLPLEEHGTAGVDRRRLSLEYSRRVKY